MNRIFRKLNITDLQLLADAKKEAGALELWEIDEECAGKFLEDPMNCFFACLEGYKVIGYVCGYELRRLDKAGSMLYIHGVGVHADYRKQGIGKRMLDEIKEMCRSNGIDKMFLYTHKTNAAACALYESGGCYGSRDDNVSYFFNNLTAGSGENI